MASTDDALDLDYDERGDILYASLGSPQAALSYEIATDIWLDYIPPSQAVVGITVLNFLQHYPVADKTQLLTEARTVIRELLRTYPVVPSDEREEERAALAESPNAAMLKIQMVSEPWLGISTTVTTAAAGTYAVPLTQSIGGVSLFERPRVQVAIHDEG